MATIMIRLKTFLFLSTLIIGSLAASPPSFCKCTCFTNSTIIALSSHTTTGGGTCATCNKDFCLKQRLPICQGATEKDIFTTCFQRDSRKDQIVVITFIAGTLGLLIWAAVRRVMEKRWAEGVRIAEPQERYTPVGTRR